MRKSDRERQGQLQEQDRAAQERAIAKSARHDRTWGSLAREAQFARDDIRHKLVEEPWFGRAVTPERVIGTADYSQDLGWTRRDKEPPHVQHMGEGREQESVERREPQERRKSLGWTIERSPQERAEIDRQTQMNLEQDQEIER
jgi:hypothetical protein